MLGFNFLLLLLLLLLLCQAIDVACKNCSANSAQPNMGTYYMHEDEQES